MRTKISTLFTRTSSKLLFIDLTYKMWFLKVNVEKVPRGQLLRHESWTPRIVPIWVEVLRSSPYWNLDFSQRHKKRGFGLWCPWLRLLYEPQSCRPLLYKPIRVDHYRFGLQFDWCDNCTTIWNPRWRHAASHPQSNRDDHSFWLRNLFDQYFKLDLWEADKPEVSCLLWSRIRQA